LQGSFASDSACDPRTCAAEIASWRLVHAARNCQRTAFYETLRAYGSRVHFHFDDQSKGLLDVGEWLAGKGGGEHVYCCGPQPYMNAPYASLSIRDDAKVKIAPVHSDCECSFWLRSLMGFAG
jgi:ferredoxin-NADP reductase